MELQTKEVATTRTERRSVDGVMVVADGGIRDWKTKGNFLAGTIGGENIRWWWTIIVVITAVRVGKD